MIKIIDRNDTMKDKKESVKLIKTYKLKFNKKNQPTLIESDGGFICKVDEVNVILSQMIADKDDLKELNIVLNIAKLRLTGAELRINALDKLMDELNVKIPEKFPKYNPIE